MTDSAAQAAMPTSAAGAVALSAADPDRRSFGLTVQLAAFLSHPLDWVDDAVCGVDPLRPAAMKAMGRHQDFRGPVNRSMAMALAVPQLPIDPGLVSRLRTAAAPRLAALLAMAPRETLGALAADLAAATFSKHVRGMVLKKEINVARSFLGDPGMQIAVNETLLLHSNLSATPWRPNSAQVFDDAARGALMGGLEALGHCVIGRFLDAVEPVLAQVFALRFPPDHEVAGRDRRVGPLGSGHCEHIVKFIRRRHRPWSQLIG